MKPLLLLLALILLLSSCAFLVPEVLPPATTAVTTTAPTATAPTTTAVTTAAPSPFDAPSYEDIERRPTNGYRIGYYGFGDDGVLLRLRHPMAWCLVKTREGYDIVRDNEHVGTLCGAPAEDADAFFVLMTESRFEELFGVTKYIEKRKGGTEIRYRYVYDLMVAGVLRTVTLTASCAEIDGLCEESLYRSAVPVEKAVSETLGALSPALGEPSSLLILGNSFIGTSDIGDILSEMMVLGGRRCTVEAISRGYARVGTYTSDEYLMASIREGDYSAVFICGFYGEAEVENLGILKAVCDASGTALVIFPAHNEGAAIVASAKEVYPSLFCLNWKAELDTLIGRGVDRWDLCINDEHLHSTPLAGYVGAHMIYRAIYGELPTEPLHTALTQSYVDGKLFDYAYTGDGHIGVADVIVYFDTQG